MPVAPSIDDLIDQGTAELSSRRPDLLVAEGDVTQAMLHAGAAMADANIRFTAQSFNDTFITLSKGDALTAVVADRIGLERHPATPSTITVVFSRTSSGAAGIIGAGTTAATAIGADGNEIRFTTDVGVPVALGANGPFSVAATATTSGRATNVAIGAVTRVVDPLFDSFSVTNVVAAAGGNDEEKDADLILRASKFWQSLRRGTLEALEFGALLVPSVRVVRVTEDETGAVLVVVTDEDGNSNAQMISDVENILETYRAAGSVVTVAGGIVVTQEFEILLVVKDGVDVVAMTPDVIDATRARVAKLRMGERLYLDQPRAAIIAVDPDGIEAVQFVVPAADNLFATPFEVYRAGNITVGEAP